MAAGAASAVYECTRSSLPGCTNMFGTRRRVDLAFSRPERFMQRVIAAKDLSLSCLPREGVMGGTRSALRAAEGRNEAESCGPRTDSAGL